MPLTEEEKVARVKLAKLKDCARRELGLLREQEDRIRAEQAELKNIQDLIANKQDRIARIEAAAEEVKNLIIQQKIENEGLRKQLESRLAPGV
jgi:hypothetical protein